MSGLFARLEAVAPRLPCRRHLLIACLLASSLGSCRAFDDHRCSAPETIATVKSLMGENSDNPVALLLKAGNATFSLDAIRTLSTSAGASMCEGRLTIEYHMLRDGKMVVGIPMGPMAGQKPVQETPEGRAFREQIERQLGTKVYEVTYKVATTDDGQAYVTIVPSDADVSSQQNTQRQDRERQRQLEQNQADSAERERDYQQQLQDRRTSDWQDRQEQLEQQELQRRE